MAAKMLIDNVKIYVKAGDGGNGAGERADAPRQAGGAKAADAAQARFDARRGKPVSGQPAAGRRAGGTGKSAAGRVELDR